MFNNFTVIQRWDRWFFVWEEWKWRQWHWQHWQQTPGLTHQKTVSSFTLKTLQTYSKNLFKYLTYLTENWFQQYWAIGKAISLRYNKYIMSVKDLAVLVVFEQQQKFLLVLMQLKYVVYYCFYVIKDAASGAKIHSFKKQIYLILSLKILSLV